MNANDTTSSSLPWVNLSMSACKDSEAIGFDDHAINRLTIRIAEYFLYRDYRLMFGHDWREDGVMRAVSELAERTAAGNLLDETVSIKQRMLNLVPVTQPEDVSKLALSTMRGTRPVLAVHAISEINDKAVREELTTQPSALNALADHAATWLPLGAEPLRLWVLRAAMTHLLAADGGIRICLGGKSSKYTGIYSGIAEEAFLALKLNVPLYLIGGFGGGTRDVIKALQGKALDATSLNPRTDDETKRFITNGTDLAETCKIPIDGLGVKLQCFGLNRLSKNNHLTIDENRALFKCTDIERALTLIWRGARHLSKGPQQ